MTEVEILDDLISKWVSLALEYGKSAPDVSAIFLYAASEDGETYANAFFEQRGTISYPDDLMGVDSNVSRVQQMQRLLLDDLDEAERFLLGNDVVPPTEYRVFYDPATSKLDMQLSREKKFGAESTRVMYEGIEMWLGERAPKLI